MKAILRYPLKKQAIFTYAFLFLLSLLLLTQTGCDRDYNCYNNSDCWLGEQCALLPPQTKLGRCIPTPKQQANRSTPKPTTTNNTTPPCQAKELGAALSCQKTCFSFSDSIVWEDCLDSCNTNQLSQTCRACLFPTEKGNTNNCY